MRITRLISCIISLYGIQAIAAEQAVNLESLLREMVDRDALGRLPEPAYTGRSASSYDRASKSPSDPAGWFANSDWSNFIRMEKNHDRSEWVMMDADGPGCITRFWTGGEKPTGHVRFYLDHASDPVIDEPLYEFLAGKGVAPPPLAIENPARAGNLYLPVPYGSHCKITYQQENAKNPAAIPTMRFWNIEYRTYQPGTAVQSYTAEAFRRHAGLIAETARTLSQPPVSEGGKELVLDESIDPGRQSSIELPPGSGALRQITLRLAELNAKTAESLLRTTVLVAEFDGEQTIWCPFSEFFGSGVGLNPLKCWTRTVLGDGAMTSRWVMPYRKGGRLTVLNLGKQKVTVHLKALAGNWKWDERSMHFHTTWRQQARIPTRPRSDWNYVTATGHGVYVGDTLSVFNPSDQWWGEGDEKIWVDGGGFPSYFGTGSEDYYGYAWGCSYVFQGPFCNQPRGGAHSRGHTTDTRTRCLDAIPFAQSLKFDLEIWHWQKCEVSYSAACYWYATPGATSNVQPQPEEAMREIPVTVTPVPIVGALLFEDMRGRVWTHSPGVEEESVALDPSQWKGRGHRLIQTHAIGDFAEIGFAGSKLPPVDPKPQRVTLYVTKSADYGVLRFSIDGKVVGSDYDAYSAVMTSGGPIDLGVIVPRQKSTMLRVQVVGFNPASRGLNFGLEYLKLTEEPVPSGTSPSPAVVMPR